MGRWVAGRRWPWGVAPVALLVGVGLWSLRSSEPPSPVPASASNASKHETVIVAPPAPQKATSGNSNPGRGPPRIEVMVRDEFDNPVRGARVHLDWSRGARGVVLEGSPATSADGLTGPLGRVEAWGIPPGPVLVTVEAEGYVPSDRARADLAIGTKATLRIELSNGLRLSGRVLDENGQPFAEVKVVLRESGSTRRPPGGAWRSAESTTDALGASSSMGSARAITSSD